jgi:hypothetical protein
MIRKRKHKRRSEKNSRVGVQNKSWREKDLSNQRRTMKNEIHSSTDSTYRIRCVGEGSTKSNLCVLSPAQLPDLGVRR